MKKTVTYFVVEEGDKYVKIGTTTNLYRRLQGLSTANPRKISCLGVLDGDHEKDVHSMFQQYRVRGEWFTFSDQIKEWIPENCRVDLQSLLFEGRKTRRVVGEWGTNGTTYK